MGEEFHSEEVLNCVQVIWERGEERDWGDRTLEREYIKDSPERSLPLQGKKRLNCSGSLLLMLLGFFFFFNYVLLMDCWMLSLNV